VELAQKDVHHLLGARAIVGEGEEHALVELDNVEILGSVLVGE